MSLASSSLVLISRASWLLLRRVSCRVDVVGLEQDPAMLERQSVIEVAPELAHRRCRIGRRASEAANVPASPLAGPKRDKAFTV